MYGRVIALISAPLPSMRKGGVAVTLSDLLTEYAVQTYLICFGGVSTLSYNNSCSAHAHIGKSTNFGTLERHYLCQHSLILASQKVH